MIDVQFYIDYFPSNGELLMHVISIINNCIYHNPKQMSAKLVGDKKPNEKNCFILHIHSSCN